MRRARGVILTGLMLGVALQLPAAQQGEVRRIGATVSYVAIGTVYINAGRAAGLAVGDTLTVTHRDTVRGKVTITAISTGSSAASIVNQLAQFAIGDSVIVQKVVTAEEQAPEAAARPVPAAPRTNVVSGRIGVQYIGAGALGSRTDFSQPGMLLQLNVARVFGEDGVNFTMYGRAYRDLSPSFQLYDPGGSRNRFRLFEMSLTYDKPEANTGYSVGRVISRFMGGLGAFDGGQFYVRKDHWSLGALLGTQPDYRTSDVTTYQQKAALFVNYATSRDVFRASDITLGYVQQRYYGHLDRLYMYLQTSARFSQDLFLYQSAEFDLKKQENFRQSSTFQPTNVFATLSYAPPSWFSASIGYNAMRNIYLLKSMRDIADTLIDRHLQQGVHINSSARIPMNIILTGLADFRFQSGPLKSSRTLGGGLRMSDVAHSGFNIGTLFMDIGSVYTQGHDLQADVERWISSLMSITLRYDRYSYTLLSTGAPYTATTGSFNLNCRLSQAWYTMLNLDQVWDVNGRSQRVFLELGMRF